MTTGNEKSNLAGHTRSLFVTVVAWTFIAFSGLATFISLLQALMFVFVFPADQMATVASNSKELEQMPAIFRLMIQNMHWFFAIFWSLCFITLIASIGLLRRRNWARLIFIGIMALGVVWNLGGIWVQGKIMSSFPKPMGHEPTDFAAGFDTMMSIMSYAMYVFAIAMSVILAWIVKRLMSRAIRDEFKPL